MERSSGGGPLAAICGCRRKALITFLFGAVSHQLGDMSWHALMGLDSGFIRAVANTSFDGDYTKGHTLADIGAEFVLSHMSKMDHLLTSWKVPVKDISQIYKRMGYLVPGPVLSHCMRNGFAGAQANARLGSQLFPVYASKSPFLIEQVINYPIGGLRDMSEWTVDCWDGLAKYLNHELELPDDEDRKANRTMNMCYALWEERVKNHHENAMKLTREGEVRHQHGGGAADGVFALTRLDLAGLQVRSETDEDTGMVTFSIEEIKTEDESINIDFESSMENQEEFSYDSQGQYKLSGDQTYSQQKLTWNSKTHQSELLFKKSKHPHPTMADTCLSFSDELESQSRTFYLPIEYSSLGHAAVTGDFDGDGNPDLVVSAPHMRLDPLVPSQGAVFVIHGTSLFTGEDNEDGVDIRSIASQSLYGDPTEPQSRFGWSLAVVDLNQDGIDDLAVGAPGHNAKGLKYDGSVFVYFGHSGTGLSETPDLILYHNRAKDEEAEVPWRFDTLNGLGYALYGLDLTGSGFKDLVIGTPMATAPIEQLPQGEDGNDNGIDDNGEDDNDKPKWKPPKFKAQAGKVLVFLSSAKHVGQKLDTDRDWELQGSSDFEWFGASIAIVTQKIQDDYAKSISKYSSFLGWLNPSRYLSHCGRSHFKKDLGERRILVVGSPTFGVGENGAMRGKIQGFVIPDFSRNPLEETQKIFTIHGDIKFQQLGSSLMPNRVLIEGSEVPQDFLVVGSQSEDVVKRLPRVGHLWQAGVVRILDISLIPDGSEVNISELDANQEIVRDFLQGSQSMSHLSADMEVSTDGNSIWLTEPYANSETGRIVEWVPDMRKREDNGNGGRGRRRGVGEGERRRDILGVRGRRLIHSDYLGGGDDDGGDDADQDRIRQCFIGSTNRDRFGSNLIVSDLTRNGLDDVVVTSSHASQFAK
ncbi:Glycosylphosphatidylinositol specific phospholipase D1 [Entomortierella beljakovae]|nr:Glycosylphosphatidylinositol specific phospholipase D1 [Entomortierella beljakovae]